MNYIPPIGIRVTVSSVLFRMEADMIYNNVFFRYEFTHTYIYTCICRYTDTHMYTVYIYIHTHIYIYKQKKTHACAWFHFPTYCHGPCPFPPAQVAWSPTPAAPPRPPWRRPARNGTSCGRRRAGTSSRSRRGRDAKLGRCILGKPW